MEFNKEDLIKKWQHVIDVTQDIFSWDGPDDIAFLCEVAENSKRIIECGVYMGKGSKCMLLASPQAQLWAVDPFMVAGTKEVACYWLRDEIREGRANIVPFRTIEAGRALDTLKGTIDLVFIDDGHALEDVLTDIKTWLPFVRSGGILCGHDFEGPWVGTEPNEVTQAVYYLIPDAKWTGCGRMWHYVKP